MNDLFSMLAYCCPITNFANILNLVNVDKPREISITAVKFGRPSGAPFDFRPHREHNALRFRQRWRRSNGHYAP